MARRQTLDDTEKAVLEFVELRGNATIPEIARAIRITGPRARRILDSLLERKLLYRYVHLNVYPLGYFEVDLLVALKNNSREMSEKIICWCIGHEKVSFVAEIGGQYNLKIGLTIKSIQEVSQFLESVCEQFDFPFSRKQILTIIEQFVFGIHKGISEKEPPTVRVGFCQDVYKLLPHDHEILKLLSSEPRLTPHGMAKNLKIPVSTLNYRLEKLEKGGVIAGYRYLFDPLGRTLEYFNITVSLGGVTPRARKVVQAFCARHPLIPFFAEVQGEADFIIQVAAKKSLQVLEVIRLLEEALAPIHPTIESYQSPTIRKLAKYPFV